MKNTTIYIYCQGFPYFLHDKRAPPRRRGYGILNGMVKIPITFITGTRRHEPLITAVLPCILIVLLLAVLAATSEYMRHTPYYNETHIHADFAVHLDGTQIAMTADAYQSDGTVARHGFLHLHDNDGTVLHIHAKRQSFADFLGSVGIRLDADCLYVRNTITCRGDGLQMFVNGEPYTRAFDRYEPRDLDRILLTDSTDTETAERELASVTDKACIQSGICPERGTASESCLSEDTCSLPPRVEPLSSSFSHPSLR